MKHRLIKIIVVLAAAGILVLICLGLWLHSGQLTQAKLKFFKKIPYPLALVNGHPVWMKDFILRLNLADKISNTGQGQTSAVYKQLINDEELAQIASKHNVSLSKKQTDQAFKQSSSETNFETTLNSYGLSGENFKTQVLEPQLLLTNLQIWFNSRESLSPDAYKLADSLLKEIRAGGDMSALAANSTQEESGKITGGDLGFVDPADLLDELREPVAGLKPDEVKILPSRAGLHIIKNEGLSGNKIHLRQIFIKPSDFNQWLMAEQQNFKIWNLVKI